MTEQEWLDCSDPEKMVDFLLGKKTGGWRKWFGKGQAEVARNPSATDRKLRLFACACCRRIWGWLPDKRSQEAVEVSECFADGQAGEEDLQLACINAAAVVEALYIPLLGSPEAGHLTSVRGYWAARAAAEAASPHIAPAVNAVQEAVERAAVEHSANEGGDPRWTAGLIGAKFRARLLRDYFGPLPFRPVVVDPTWRTWNNETAPRLARAIYSDWDFDRLPILADALEEAGCTDPEILKHLRGPGPHVRGCWVVDLLLETS